MNEKNPHPHIMHTFSLKRKAKWKKNCMADEGDDFSFKVWQFKLGITSECERMTKYKRN